MKVMIFEPTPNGHRFQYVAVMVTAFRKRVDSLVVVTSEGARNATEYAIHLQAMENAFILDDSLPIDRRSTFRFWLDTYRAFWRSVARHRPDLVYIPFGDGLVQLLGVGRLLRLNRLDSDTRLFVMLFRGRIPGSGQSLLDAARARSWQALVRAANAERYLFINPYQFEGIRQHGLKRLAERARVFPEPVEPMETLSKRAAREKLGIPPDGRYIACLGRLDGRKGVDLAVRAFARAAIRETDRLLLLGEAAPEVTELLDGEFRYLLQERRIILIDRHVDQAELEAGLFAADVICTPYPDHLTSSGFVVRAAAVGRPILASDVGWMGRVVPAFDLGMTCRVRDQTTFSIAIATMFDAADTFEMSCRARAFVRYHTLENTVAHWRATLPASRDMKGEPELIEWDEILAECGQATDEAKAGDIPNGPSPALEIDMDVMVSRQATGSIPVRDKGVS